MYNQCSLSPLHYGATIAFLTTKRGTLLAIVRDKVGFSVTHPWSVVPSGYSGILRHLHWPSRCSWNTAEIWVKPISVNHTRIVGRKMGSTLNFLKSSAYAVTRNQNHINSMFHIFKQLRSKLFHYFNSNSIHSKEFPTVLIRNSKEFPTVLIRNS